MLSIKIFAFLLLLSVAFSSNCGGNCPAGDCPSCPCGTAKTIINSTDYCPKYSWNQNCCKCIISKTSKYNKHYMQYYDPWFFLGILPIDQEDLVNDCNLKKQTDWCLYGNNLACAYRQFQFFDKKWTYWFDQAKACGCPYDQIAAEKLKQYVKKE